MNVTSIFYSCQVGAKTELKFLNCNLSRLFLVLWTKNLSASHDARWKFLLLNFSICGYQAAILLKLQNVKLCFVWNGVVWSTFKHFSLRKPSINIFDNCLSSYCFTESPLHIFGPLVEKVPTIIYPFTQLLTMLR